MAQSPDTSLLPGKNITNTSAIAAAKGWVTVMPEIPEIETVRKQLEHKTREQTIVSVVVNREKALNVSVEHFTQALSGQRIATIRRRAKQIILGLSNNHSLVIHFMLEGYARLFYADEKLTGKPSVVLGLNSGGQLAFFKMNLGYIHLVPTTDFAEMSELRDLGPEPLATEFTLDKFLLLLKERKGMIKPLLMDQEFIAGIGNVYSNEVLFCSRILPTRKVINITGAEQANLYNCIRDILSQAVKLGGVYEEKFTSDDNLTGSFEPHLKVAYRTGKPCCVCGHDIKTQRVGGRNAFFCPVCQQ